MKWTKNWENGLGRIDFLKSIILFLAFLFEIIQN